MAITRVRTYNGIYGSSATNVTITSPTPGNRIVAVTGSRGYNNTYPGTTITQSGVTWSLAASYYTGSTKYMLAMVWISNPQPVGASTTITVTGSANTSGVYHFAEYSGIHRAPGIPATVLGGAGAGVKGNGNVTVWTGGTGIVSPNANHVYAGSIAVQTGSGSGIPPTYYSPTNGFTIVDQTVAGSGSVTYNCRGVWVENIAVGTSTSCSVSPLDVSIGYGANIAAFNEQLFYSIVHTTDAYLKREFSLSHTTDSSLKKSIPVSHNADLIMEASPRSHSTDLVMFVTRYRQHNTDTSLVAETQQFHTTDIYLEGLIREPIHQKVFNIYPPNGDNVGEYEVSLSGVCGSSDVANIEYQKPPQETVIGRNHNVEISITDPILKSRL